MWPCNSHQDSIAKIQVNIQMLGFSTLEKKKRQINGKSDVKSWRAFTVHI